MSTLKTSPIKNCRGLNLSVWTWRWREARCIWMKYNTIMLLQPSIFLWFLCFDWVTSWPSSESAELRSVSLDDLNVGGRSLKQQSEWQQWYYTESQSHTVYPLISLLHWFSPLLRENLFCVDWYWREIRSELWAEEIIQTSSASLIWVSSGRQHTDRVKQVSQDDGGVLLHRLHVRL